MTRPARLFLDGVPLHVVQRGLDRASIFFGDADFDLYRHCLGKAARENACDVHAYVLMTNHVHLLVTPRDEGAVGRMMQSLGGRYVKYLNERLGRTGTLWEGRYRATAVDSERYFLACCRYIELNPVRAGLVAHPGGWRWSSWHAHAEGARDGVLAAHAILDGLGTAEYAALVASALAEDVVEAIRAATRSGLPLGDERFRARFGAPPRPRGRPRKNGV